VRGNKVDQFAFPRILRNPCFSSKAAALRYYLRLQWRGVKLRLDAGCLADWLPLAMVIGAAILLYIG
jgi:hypothetical protein